MELQIVRIFAFLLTMALMSAVRADDISAAIDVLRAVRPGAADSAAARNAVQEVTTGGSQALLPLLHGFRDATPLSVNWLRNAFEQMADAETKAGRQLPQSELEAFVADQSQSPFARRLVYETLKRTDPGIENRLIPDMLLDASPEFRRDAVALLMTEASHLQDAAIATPLYRKAFSGAVHEDQVKTIAEALRKHNEEVDIQKHFGFLSQWSIVGPFDNKEEKGFAMAYGPELEVNASLDLNLQAEYDGQSAKVRWQSI